MEAYWQEVRKLEEKFDGFELHHILRRDNEAAETLARLGSSREPPPSGVFAHDLFKPSIWLEEDVLAPMPGTSLSKDSPVPRPGPLSSEDGAALAPKAKPGVSARPVGQT
jgi:hypothetical protein